MEWGVIGRASTRREAAQYEMNSYDYGRNEESSEKCVDLAMR